MAKRPHGIERELGNCQQPRKPRVVTIDFDFGKPVALSGFSISSDRIVPLSNAKPVHPASTTICASYERPKGPKVLNKAGSLHDEITFNPDIALSKFDLIFAVDTNTVDVDDQKLSITCVVLCRFERTSHHLEAKFAPINCLEFRNVRGNPEVVAWVKTIQLIRANPNFRDGIRIGLIVDSELGLLDEFNSRQKAILGDFFLPTNFQLLYATSDSGKEYLANTLLATCDKDATDMIDRITKNPSEFGSIPRTDSPNYTHFRIWHI